MRNPPYRFAANISIMFTEVPYLDRPAAARAAGFGFIESWWPFADPVGTRDQVDSLVDAIARAGVALCAINFWAGDMPSGQRGVTSHPDQGAVLSANTDQLLQIAERTGCRQFNLLYGQLDERWSPQVQHDTAIEAYTAAADRVAGLGATILIEPLAAGLNGAYPLVDGDDVISLITGPLARSTNVRLLFDVFHLGSNGVDLVTAARRMLPWIGHVQIADAPGRGEPGSGQLPIDSTLAELAARDYAGFVAGEYTPTTDTTQTLDWLSHRTRDVPTPGDRP